MLDQHDSLLIRAGNYSQLRGSRDFGEEQFEGSIAGEARSKHSLSRSSSPESKWQKIDKSLYVWKVHKQITPVTLPVNLERTRSMVQNYTADLKHALWSL